MLRRSFRCQLNPPPRTKSHDPISPCRGRPPLVPHGSNRSLLRAGPRHRPDRPGHRRRTDPGRPRLRGLLRLDPPRALGGDRIRHRRRRPARPGPRRRDPAGTDRQRRPQGPGHLRDQPVLLGRRGHRSRPLLEPQAGGGWRTPGAGPFPCNDRASGQSAGHLQLAGAHLGAARLRGHPFAVAGDRPVPGVSHGRRSQRVARSQGGHRLA